MSTRILKIDEFKKFLLKESIEGTPDHESILINNYVLSKWKDDEDYSWCIGIMKKENYDKINTEINHFCIFACENPDEPNSKIEIRDHGLIVMQYLTDEEKSVIESCGIKIGETFNTINEIWMKFKQCGKIIEALILEGKKSDQEKLDLYRKQLANWDEAHESELAKKRKGSTLTKKERLRKRIARLVKKIKRITETPTE